MDTYLTEWHIAHTHTHTHTHLLQQNKVLKDYQIRGTSILKQFTSSLTSRLYVNPLRKQAQFVCGVWYMYMSISMVSCLNSDLPCVPVWRVGERCEQGGGASSSMFNQHTRELISAPIRNTNTTRNTSTLQYEHKYSNKEHQRPESPTVTLTWHACKYKVHKLHQRYILKKGCP